MSDQSDQRGRTPHVTPRVIEVDPALDDVSSVRAGPAAQIIVTERTERITPNESEPRPIAVREDPQPRSRVISFGLAGM